MDEGRRNLLKYSALLGGVSALAGLTTGLFLGFERGYNRGVEDKNYRQKERPARGDIAKDFSLTALDGKVYQLSQYAGKPVVLNFWETWCPPCRGEMPTLNNFARLYGDKVIALAVTTDESRNTEHYIRQNGFSSFTVLLDKDGKVFRDYNITSIPKTFVIDTEGKIVEYASGSSDFTNPRGQIRKAIDSILSEKGNLKEKPRHSDLSEKLA